MNDKLIASDAPFTPEEQAILSALADTIVPASEDGVMPSAGELDVAGFIAENAADFLTELGEILKAFDADFAGETLAVRVDRVKAFSEAQPEAFGACWPRCTAATTRTHACSSASASVPDRRSRGATPWNPATCRCSIR